MAPRSTLATITLALTLTACDAGPTPNSPGAPAGARADQKVDPLAQGTPDEAKDLKTSNAFQSGADLAKRRPGHRAVFEKQHVCARGTFTILPDVPGYAQGIFGDAALKGDHPAWVRLSSDVDTEDGTGPDSQRFTLGFAIKVFNIPGPKVLDKDYFTKLAGLFKQLMGVEDYDKRVAGDINASTHDFLLQNAPVFFADTDVEMFAASTGGMGNPREDDILNAGKKLVRHLLKQTFYSAVPYKFGPNDFAKYRVVPCGGPVPIEPPTARDQNNPNYIASIAVSDLRAGSACFEFQVQKRVGDMPLDRATVRWREPGEAPSLNQLPHSTAISEPVTVAKLVLAQDKNMQAPTNPNDPGSVCETLSFNAWHAAPDHKPVGTIQELRHMTYTALSLIRRSRNAGVSLSEPVTVPTAPAGVGR
jgi:hypothetical protein